MCEGGVCGKGDKSMTWEHINTLHYRWSVSNNSSLETQVG